MTQGTLHQWADDMGGWHLPRWQELPEIELYMDQVVAFLEAQLCKLWLPGEKFITAAMVNNYVKLGLLPKPVKKKYGRPHIARLIVITLIKQSMPLTDIKYSLDIVLRQCEAEELYNAFCIQQEQALSATGAALLSKEEEGWQKLLQLSAQAAASCLAVKIGSKNLQ